MRFPSDTSRRVLIRNRLEFIDFWKRALIPATPGVGIPPMPEIDFSREMLVIAVMEKRPAPNYWIFIDGACDMDGHLEIFVTSADGNGCTTGFEGESYPADVIMLPRSDLPVVFRETKIDCRQWMELLLRYNQR